MDLIVFWNVLYLNVALPAIHVFCAQVVLNSILLKSFFIKCVVIMYAAAAMYVFVAKGSF